MLTIKEPNADALIWIHQYPGDWRRVSSQTIQALQRDRGSVRTQHQYTQRHPPEFMTYDRLVDEPNYHAILGEVMRNLIPYHCRNENAVALEMGCSVDVSMHRYIGPHFFGRYMGMDVHQESVYESRHSTNLDVICGSFHQIPLRDNAVDLLIEANAYDMTRCLTKALQEAYRVLRPGGAMIAFQDVIPNAIATLGLALPGEVVLAYFRDGIQEDNQGIRNPLVLMGDEGHMDVRSYHLSQVAKSARKAGFIVVHESLIEVSDLVAPRGKVPIEFSSVDHRCAKYVYYRDSKVPLGQRKAITSANVVVMRKPWDPK